jgi:hypothetical protein
VILWTRPTHVQLLALAPESAPPLLQAHLPLRIEQPSAPGMLLWSLAHWTGRPVRAVVTADESGALSATSLCHDLAAFLAQGVQLRLAHDEDALREALALPTRRSP